MSRASANYFGCFARRCAIVTIRRRAVRLTTDSSHSFLASCTASLARPFQQTPMHSRRPPILPSSFALLLLGQ
jgi:hypothetical protein